MKRYLLLALSAAVFLPLASAAVSSADVTPRSVSTAGEPALGTGIRNLDDRSPFEPDGPLAPTQSDADRGCCVWKSSPAKCTFTNRGYCKTKADQANVPFDFYVGTKCSAVSACPGNSPGSRYLSPTFLERE